MPKLLILSGQQLSQGPYKSRFFSRRTARKPHVKLKKRLHDRVIVTTVPLHRALDTGTLLGILKQTEVTRDQLFELLE